MYRFSRSIYRELSPSVVADQHDGDLGKARQEVLEACEATMRRLALDRRYFAHPARTLFSDVRTHIPINQQLHAYVVIDWYVNLALEHLEKLPETGQRECQASTRKGTPCRREPLPGRDYCPSHKHLEEVFEEELIEVGAVA